MSPMEMFLTLPELNASRPVTSRLKLNVHRGQAISMMDRLAQLKPVQDCLREIALYLIRAPFRTCLVSELGLALSPGTQALFKTLKLGLSKFLRCFPDDFHVGEAGSATTVSHKQARCKEYYVPKQLHLKVVVECYGAPERTGADGPPLLGGCPGK